MTRSTPSPSPRPRALRDLLLGGALALAGCQDGAPPTEPATSAPDPVASVAPRLAKTRAFGARAIAPGVPRSLLQTMGEADGGAPVVAEADGGAAAATPDAAAPLRALWSFDKDKVDTAPPGFDFAASAGKPGKWRVMADPGTTTVPNVLAQLDADKTDARFLTAVAVDPSVRDARVSVRCKPVSGKVDQSCGLVARFQDAKNYYLARANALEKDVNLYVVKDGKRTLVGGWKSPNVTAVWHELRVDAKGDHLELYWDGAKVYEASDKTFPEAGRFGLWTKADSVTYFDDLSITAL